jgi:hypothetical protein
LPDKSHLTIAESDTIEQAFQQLNANMLGILFARDADGRVIGAVTDGFASSQASAIDAGWAPVSAATASSAARMRRPRSFMYFGMPRAPRGLLP